ncbi:MAG: UDP-N-acetylmuramoyl-L-alanine--D-glutamate ligase [Eubacteriales bacterium]|nr:UDP-N-acetylmuramoyl-L-alanine--D-glutamate ligase [Eubacteriales bacterium]
MRYMIVGMAKSGQAAARRLLEAGHEVVLSDLRSVDKFNGELASLTADPRVTLRLGEKPDAYVGSVDKIVISPGVPIQSAFIAAAKERGIEVLGEIELAYRLNHAPVIGITGTNGKTTTTALIGQIMADAGRRTHVVGNIGTPYVCVEDARPDDIFVAEISSFQLESIHTFRAHTALILNITEDHLNRHGTMEEYIRMKKRIFENQTAKDWAVLNRDDAILREISGLTGRVVWFSRKEKPDEGAFVEDGWIKWRLDGKEESVVPVDEIKILGTHNLENALAAVAAARLNGVNAESIRGTLGRFQGVEHRLEYVTTIDGVDFINDSKGTNPDASIKAVEAVKGDMVVIAGGSEKKSDYRPFIRSFGGRVRHMVLIGRTAGEIAAAAKECGYRSYSYHETFEGAIRAAFAEARRFGGTVLLSPACASFDMFEDYEQRGRIFKQIVWQLKKENADS